MKFLKVRSKEIKELQPDAEEKSGKTRENEENFESPVKLPEIRKAVTKPVFRPQNAQSPPLFIKVDKYRDIIKSIRDLRSYILNLRDALDVLRDMQKEVANGIEIAGKTLDELNEITSNLDSFFMKPQTIGGKAEDFGRPGIGEEEEEARDSMKDVYGQLEKLRAQLRAIS